MRLEQFDYLIALDTYHSMNEASKHIFVSQQSISSAILELEEEFQVRLVTRTNKGSYLTKEGKELATAARQFFDRCEAVRGIQQEALVIKCIFWWSIR